MDNLSFHLETLRNEYRSVFLQVAQEVAKSVSELKPENFEGEIFDNYPIGSVGKKWQDDVILLLKDKYYPELFDLKAQINSLRNHSSCSNCGKCCRLACSEFSYDELKKKAQQGDNYAKQFVETFIPYEDEKEVLKIYPEYLKMLENKNETGYYFYHCPKVTEENLCPDYENRPQICRDFPDNPVAFLPKGCGYSDWKFESENISLKLNALFEIVTFYAERLK